MIRWLALRVLGRYNTPMNPEPMSVSSPPRSLKAVVHETPQAVTATLEKYRLQIKEVCGANFICFALYGGIVRGRYLPDSSDINAILIVNEMTTDLLGQLGPILRSAWREIRLDPFLLARSELPRATVVFPTKMLDIRRFHRVLDGEDMLSSLEIRREDLSLRIEQELRNLTLRLRRRFIAIEHDDIALGRALREVAIPVRVVLLAMLDLAGTQVSDEPRTPAVYAQAAERFKLDAQALEKLSAVRDQPGNEGDIRGLYLRIMQLLSRTAEIARDIATRA